jgi:hypothetical protein
VIIDALPFRPLNAEKEGKTGTLSNHWRRIRVHPLRILSDHSTTLWSCGKFIIGFDKTESMRMALEVRASRRVRSTGMQYEFAPVEVLDVADALLFRANALGQDKKERATQLRTLAIKVLGTSKPFKKIVEPRCADDRSKPHQLSTE